MMCGFTAMAASPVRFGVIADIQYRDNDNPSVSKYYKDSALRLDRAVKHFNEEDLDFVIVLGDMKDYSENMADLKSVFTGEYTGQNQLYGLDHLKTPYKYYAMGNHDLNSINHMEATGYVQQKMSNITPLVKSTFDNNTSLAYTFTVPGKDHFLGVVLDGTEISRCRYGKTNSIVENERNKVVAVRGEGDFIDWNGGVSSTQLKGLDAVLSSADKENKDVIIFSHFPVWPEDNSHNLWNEKEVLETIERYNCVVAYVNGHDHVGDQGYRGSTSYITVKGMLLNENSSAYGIMTLNERYLVEEGFVEEPNRVIKHKNSTIIKMKDLY